MIKIDFLEQFYILNLSYKTRGGVQKFQNGMCEVIVGLLKCLVMKIL